ncbi:MAG: hypothetical protein BWY27_01237 [Bacteroidetes bacterium ADurb.Bin234]|jgi:hypothetical protein|nr:MAG: hypothetical protein BWY27_01237 [Bacteroidetes bacterium ADurb.Bin234]
MGGVELQEKENVKINREIVMMFQKFNFDGFLNTLEKGKTFVDFDAGTGHNHGTKFRLKHLFTS